MAVKEMYLDKLTEWVESLISQRDNYFLVQIKILPGNQIRIFVDADNGASINELAKINKALRKQIDAEGWYAEGDYSLEVSSPGLDEPLIKLRQYKKNEGREIEIVLTDGRKKKGLLKEVKEDNILLVPKPKKGKGKKATEIKREPEYFSLDKIKTTKVCISF